MSAPDGRSSDPRTPFARLDQQAPVRERSTTPPDALRTSSTPEERALLNAQLGVVVPVDDAPALLDPRGRRFQRLEWLGDSLLDVLVARVRAADPSLSATGFTTDVALAAKVAATGLPDRLDWQPSPQRLADLVEASIAAGHRAAGFFGARTVAVRLVSEQLAEPKLPKSLTAQQAAEAGAAVLEAASALLLFASRPDDDEGALTARRARLLDSDRIAAQHGDGQGTVEEQVDRLQAELGRVLVIRGERAAQHAALPLLR